MLKSGGSLNTRINNQPKTGLMTLNQLANYTMEAVKSRQKEIDQKIGYNNIKGK